MQQFVCNNRARQRRQAGQSMVEFALVLPLLLGLFLAVMEIGRYWGAKHGVVAAAREGARLMMLPSGPGTKFGSQDEINQAAVNTVKTYLNATGLAHEGPLVEITPMWYDTANKQYSQDFGSRDLRRGDQVGVLVAYQFETPLKFLLIGGDGIMVIKQLALLDHE